MKVSGSTVLLPWGLAVIAAALTACGSPTVDRAASITKSNEFSRAAMGKPVASHVTEFHWATPDEFGGPAYVPGVEFARALRFEVAIEPNRVSGPESESVVADTNCNFAFGLTGQETQGIASALAVSDGNSFAEAQAHERVMGFVDVRGLGYQADPEPRPYAELFYGSLRGNGDPNSNVVGGRVFQFTLITDRLQANPEFPQSPDHSLAISLWCDGPVTVGTARTGYGLLGDEHDRQDTGVDYVATAAVDAYLGMIAQGDESGFMLSYSDAVLGNAGIAHLESPAGPVSWVFNSNLGRADRHFDYGGLIQFESSAGTYRASVDMAGLGGFWFSLYSFTEEFDLVRDLQADTALTNAEFLVIRPTNQASEADESE